MTTAEKLLEALLNGETTDIEPKSRFDQCLLNILESKGTEGLPEPRSNMEAYLHALAEKLINGGGSGGSTGVSSELAARLVARTITNADMPVLFELCPGWMNSANAFANCSQLTKVVFPAVNAYQFMGSLFTACTNLAEVDMSKVSVQYMMGEIFKGTLIEHLEFPANLVSHNYTCSGMAHLKTVIFKGSALKQLTETFYSCTSLELVDFSRFTGTQVPAIGSKSVNHANKTWIALVPVSLIRPWKVTTNWVTMKDRIVCSLDAGYSVTTGIEITCYINGEERTLTAGETVTGVHCIGAGDVNFMYTDGGETITTNSGVDSLITGDVQIIDVA